MAVLIQQNTPGGAVTDASSTRGSAVHNMWPNATSEASPPDGADRTTAEWAARVNAGTGAFAGNYVREVSATHGAATVLLGDGIGGTNPFAVAGAATLSCKARCSPGEAFSLEVQIRFTAQAVGGGDS